MLTKSLILYVVVLLVFSRHVEAARGVRGVAMDNEQFHSLESDVGRDLSTKSAKSSKEKSGTDKSGTAKSKSSKEKSATDKSSKEKSESGSKSKSKSGSGRRRHAY